MIDFRFGGDVVFGKAFRFGQSGGGPSGPETDPTITAIAINGWEAVSNDASTFDAPYDPHVAPSSVVIPREGFDPSGNAVTRNVSIPIMSRVREPSPVSAIGVPVFTASDTAMHTYVYAGETIQGGATNNSTRAFPMPQLMWLDHDRQRVYNQTYVAKMAASHGHARNGRPIAAVEFFAFDGVDTVSSGIISTMSKIDYVASGKSAPGFEGSLDFSSLLDDTLIRISSRSYVWDGDAYFDAHVDFDTYPSPNFCEMYVFNAVTAAEDPIYAYIDGIGAGGGTASTTEGTAIADPFATLALAAAAIVAVDGANASRGVMKITANTTIPHAAWSVAIGDTPVILQGVNKATSIYTDSGGNIFGGTPTSLKIKDLTLQKSSNTGAVFIDSGSVGTDANMLVTENVTFDQNGFTSISAGFVYRVGRWWMIESDGIPDLHDSAAIRKMCISIGSGDNSCHFFTYHAVGCNDQANAKIAGIVSIAVRNDPVGRFFGWNFLSGAITGQQIMSFGSVTIGNRGLAIVGNVLEKTVGDIQAAITIFADDVGTTALNIVTSMNTFAGARTLLMYNASGSVGYEMSGYHSFDVHTVLATKSDLFPTANANRVGNWASAYRVTHKYNCLLEGDTEYYDYGSGYWMGEVHPLGETSGTIAVPVVADWVDDASLSGTDLGGGDYRPGGSTAIPLIPAGLAPYPYDHNGAAIANDGSAYAGALQQ